MARVRAITVPRTNLATEVVVLIAEKGCTACIIVSLSKLCRSWRRAIAEQRDVLWRKAAVARFPRPSRGDRCCGTVHTVTAHDIPAAAAIGTPQIT